MAKKWYIKIFGRIEGPFNIQELRQDHRIHPDTLACNEGETTWIPIRNIPELQSIFKDDLSPEKEPEEEDELKDSLLGQEALTLQLSKESPPYLMWILFILALIFYMIYQLSH